MANTKSTKTTKTQSENTTKVEERFDLDKQVTVRNIADWTVGFVRITSMGDVNIPPHGIILLTRAEIISQSQNGNRLINGTDGHGGHATVIIDDIPTLLYLGFINSEDEKQLVFSDELLEEVFAIKNKDKFEETFKKTFVTRAEWQCVNDAIKRLGINDYSKIRFVENYTKFKVQ